MKKTYQTSIEGFNIRYANTEDAGLILSYIRKLAIYENMLDDLVATEEDIYKSVFENKYCEVVIGEYEGKPVGFCLFFYKFSTFVGKPTLHIEDLFYDVEMRGKGFGTETFTVMSQIAKDNDCGRMEWNCLDWNEPSIQFYKGLGAVNLSDWLTFRMTKDENDNFITKKN